MKANSFSKIRIKFLVSQGKIVHSMKLLITSIGSIVISVFFSAGFAQSKKDLKIQMVELTKKNTSERIATDSIMNLKDRRITELQKQVNSLTDTLTVTSKKLAQKTQELESYMNATSRMGGRVRMKAPDLSKFGSVSPATISLRLLVDENGTVVEAINDSKRTTTNDKALLEEVVDIVKKELRYSREPGASLLQSNFTLKVGPKN